MTNLLSEALAELETRQALYKVKWIQLDKQLRALKVQTDRYQVIWQECEAAANNLRDYIVASEKGGAP